MHIVMVSGEYPPRWGGMGSVVYHLASHMAQRGHKVTVITRKHKQMPPTQTGVEVIPVRWSPTQCPSPNLLANMQSRHSINSNDADPLTLLVSISHLFPDRKQFRYIEEHCSSRKHPQWILGRRERRCSSRLLNREAATWRNPNDRNSAPAAGTLDTSGWCPRINVLCSSFSLNERRVPRILQDSDDSDIEVVHNGCDARVFRPPNKDHEGEQLAHERIRKEYVCR